MAEPVVSATEPLVTSDGSHEGFRNPDLERDADHYGPGTGGKKRKVPAFTQTLGRSDEGPDTKITDHPYPQTFPVRYRAPRSKAATACSFRKALFLRRKAALITLYIDAQNAVIAGTAKMGPNGKSPLLDVPTFEKLMPSLEDVGISDWPPDRPSWRTNWEEAAPPRIKTLEQWRTRFDQRQRVEAARTPTVRGGWAPEGSFEFEKECEATALMRARAKDRAALHKLIVDLRGIALSAKPPVKPVTTMSIDKPPQKAQRTIQKRTTPQSALEHTVPLSQTPSKESDAPSGKGKQKKKKKKRSVLANQGNPHHVDNYRPARKALAQSDPYEPYPHHASLLFPPPMRLLATGPQRKTAPLPGAAPTSRPSRAAEDDFVCCFCEIDLFFGSENMRKRAIRRMKAERRRKENIRNKAKDVAEGKGTLKDDETDFEDDYSCGDDDGTGRCTCGRQISDPHRSVKSRLKPPETDPPDDGHGYAHGHDHEHDYHGHDHDHHHDHDHDHHHDHDHDHDHDHHHCHDHDDNEHDHEYHRHGEVDDHDHLHDDVD